MIICVQGRLTEMPKPPQTEKIRRNFIVAVDSNSVPEAEAQATQVLTESGYGFITINQRFSVEKASGDPVMDKIVDEARRDGLAVAIYQ
ncbi:hypothetical protein [Cohaesibacter gelatinilyticus]|jgi:hypothetical protein|uniref:Uncharacterized protein n=1 Tax=Cohaesibacter gelatinilyticus TaxID=372072 RepID=A0A285N940_9HYPH|nr:hypothetical protein [Cohaesibacter gelatinilyticus]SNZ05808.1 hypothetical protein SAMN06265368_0211 [Cohaesibacter gelatinilyticus]HAT87245.1 hypothetical protein [Hyphomicrobiales bacterium]